MLRSLDSGVSALQQFQQSMDVIGNNIANVDTVGFKSASVRFADALSQTLAGPRAAGAKQIGTGVLTSSITNDFTQGAINNSGGVTDLAINGNGYFTVRDPLDGAIYATRAGQFRVDVDGYLVTATGLRVQGNASFDAAGAATLGDLKVDNGGGNNGGSVASVASYSFDERGDLNLRLADGFQYTRGQVLLTNFLSPEQLLKEGNSLYSGLVGAGPVQQNGTPGSNGLGGLIPSSLERSNVDIAVEMTTLITTQRAFQASAKIITTSDEMLQELVNLKR